MFKKNVFPDTYFNRKTKYIAVVTNQREFLPKEEFRCCTEENITDGFNKNCLFSEYAEKITSLMEKRSVMKK